MKLSAPEVKRAICQVDYDQALKMFSEIGYLGDDLRRAFNFDEFRGSIQEQTLLLRNSKLKRWLSVGTSRANVILNDPGIFTNFKSPAQQVLRRVCDRLGVEQLKRIGVRIMFLCTVEDSTFEELKSRLMERLCDTAGISALTLKGEPPSDMGLVLDYHAADRRGHLQIGPLRRQEVVQRYEDEEENAPELSVLVDSDYYAMAHEGPLELRLVGQMLTEGYEHGARLAAEVLRIIGG